MKIKYSIWIILLVWTCKSPKIAIEKKIIEKTMGQTTLASPILLNSDTTIVHLSDYLDNLDSLFRVFAYEGIKTSSSIKDKTLIIVPTENLLPVSTLAVRNGGKIVDLVLVKSSKIKYSMQIPDPNHHYKTVAIAGDVNAWNPANSPLTYKDGFWKIDFYLEPDTYGYQLVTDGKWGLDPNNPLKMENGMGGWNSKLVIQPEKKERPTLKTMSFKGQKVLLEKNAISKDILVLWQNQRLMTRTKGQIVHITIPEKAKEQKRTYLRAWSFNENQHSHEVFIPLEYGVPVDQFNQLTRSDKETNIMYYAMIDRFYNADTLNDAPLNDLEVDPKADFHGGDLKGIEEKIETGYFKDLGITALWLSPIIQNPEGKFGFYNEKGITSKFSSFHGYWPISFNQVDYRYGNSKDLKQIVNGAHQKDMNVFLDFVANHVHEQHPMYQKHKDWATNLYLPDGTLNTEKWDEHRLTTWFDVFLPTLDLAKQEVAEMLSDSAMFWIEEYDVDGFRHDATKHIPLNFWRTLTAKIKKYANEKNKSLYQVGETYGTPELINSYINSGMLDGQFDFNVYDALLNSICREDIGFERVEEKLKQSFNYYGVHNLMGYMTGNQDKPRFMAMATGDVLFDEDSKYAGWSRKIEKKTKLGYQKSAMMHAFIMTIPGIPVIYYGDEIGLTGGNDPDNRRDMKFDTLNENEAELYGEVAVLTRLRRENPVFLFGDFKFIKTEKDLMIYSRNYFNKTAVVIMNNSDKEIEYECSGKSTLMDVVFRSKVIGEKILVKPRSFEILMEDLLTEK